MSKSNKIVWTDEILYFVIKHVKNAPFVWDHAHPQFAFKSRKAKFWSLLAAKVNSYDKFNLPTPVTKGKTPTINKYHFIIKRILLYSRGITEKMDKYENILFV